MSESGTADNYNVIPHLTFIHRSVRYLNAVNYNNYD